VTLSAVNSCLATGAVDTETRASAKSCPVKKNPKAKHTFKQCKGRNKAPGQPASNPLTCDQWLYLLAFRIAEIKQEIKEFNREAVRAAAQVPFHFLIPEPVGAQLAGWESAQLAIKISKLNDEKNDAYALAAKDPPDSAISAIALPRVAGAFSARRCPSVRGRGASRAEAICGSDRQLFKASIETTRVTNSVLAAMLVTANRDGTALHTGHSGPAALQQAVTRILEIELANAIAAEDRAALRLAGKLHARQLVATLRRADDTAPLSTPDASVTPGVVQGMVNALVSQRAVSALAAAALGHALSAVAAANDPASLHQALAAFSSAARQVHGPAGTFLAAAEHELAAR
jgi:hypothetical protein